MSGASTASFGLSKTSVSQQSLQGLHTSFLVHTQMCGDYQISAALLASILIDFYILVYRQVSEEAI